MIVLKTDRNEKIKNLFPKTYLKSFLKCQKMISLRTSQILTTKNRSTNHVERFSIVLMYYLTKTMPLLTVPYHFIPPAVNSKSTISLVSTILKPSFSAHAMAITKHALLTITESSFINLSTSCHPYPYQALASSAQALESPQLPLLLLRMKLKCLLRFAEQIWLLWLDQLPLL